MARKQSSKGIIRQVCRRLWDEYKAVDGALEEDAHRADVERIVRADPAFVALRGAEERKRLLDDIIAAIRAIRNGSKLTAKMIVKLGQLPGNGQSLQMLLPMEQFRREQYEVPITKETKSGTDLLYAEGEACAQDLLVKSAEFNVKAQRLLWVLAEARKMRLAPTDRLGKVWGA